MADFITKQELEEKINSGWEVIDVRSPQEFSFLQKIPQSRNIPYPKIVSKMSELFPDKTSKLIMVCNGGNRSGVSADAYRKNGYDNVYYLMNGIQGLQEF